MVKRIAFNGLAILAFAASGSVSAAEGTGFYAGASIGQTSIEVDDVGFEGDDTGFKLFGGYSFNKYFALEAAYLDGGTPDDSQGNTTIEIELTGFNVSGVGTLPLTETFSLFGRIGLTSYETELVATVGNTSITIENEDEALSYGVGAAFQINKSFALRGEYEMLELDDVGNNVDFEADTSLLSISGIYRF